MTLFKALQLFLCSVIVGYLSNKLLQWDALVPIYHSDLFSYITLVGGTFLLMATTARVLAAKSWEELGQQKLFTRQFTVKVGLMCGFVMITYPLLRIYGFDRESAVIVLVMVVGTIYIIRLNHSLRKTGRGLVWKSR